MRKTVSVSLSGMLFHVEEDAYKALDAYLSSIRKHFSSYEDRDEIVSDIENRIAEHFSAKAGKKNRVLSSADIDELVAQMGTVEDFKAFESDHPYDAAENDRAEPAGMPRRLYRDPDDQMIAGVASGIAQYFDIDPVLVRFAFIVTLFFGGAGVLIYIILWIVVPEAKSASDRIEMKGYRLTIKKLEETVRQNIPAAKEKIKPGTIGRIVSFPFVILRRVLTFLAKVLRMVIPAVGRLAGFVITVASIIAMVALTFACMMLATGAWDAYTDIPVRSFLGDALFLILLFCAYAALFLPLVLTCTFGVSMLRMKNGFTTAGTVTVLALWVFALLTGGVLLGHTIPSLLPRIERYEREYNGDATRQLEIGSFSSIDVAGNVRLNVRSGDVAEAVASGSQRSLEHLDFETRDGTLYLNMNGSRGQCIICFLRSDVTIDLTVTEEIGNMRATRGADVLIDGVDISGNGLRVIGGSSLAVHDASLSTEMDLIVQGGSATDIETDTPMNALRMNVSAGSKASFVGSADMMDIIVHAGSRVQLAGTGRSLHIEGHAGSRIEAYGFAVETAEVALHSGTKAELNARQSIDGSVRSGAGIEYLGDPSVVQLVSDRSGGIWRAAEDFR